MGVVGTDWWNKFHPTAPVRELRAGNGGTGSALRRRRVSCGRGMAEQVPPYACSAEHRVWGCRVRILRTVQEDWSGGMVRRMRTLRVVVEFIRGVA